MAEQVREFERAFSALLELCQFTADLRAVAGPNLPADVMASYASLPAVIRDSGVSDDDWVAAKARCSLTAGRVAHIPDLTGVRISRPGFGGPVNPFEVWITVTQSNSEVQPDDILATSEHTIGILEAMAERVDVAADISIEDIHPLVWGAARGQWRIELYREAVSSAVGAVIDYVRHLTGRADLADKDVFTHAFSQNPPKAGAPRLRWPGCDQDQTVVSMNRGLLGFSTGIQAAIRNPTIHDRTPLRAQEAAERLAALSLLTTWIEQCRLDSLESP
ncbi:hypothetical protein A5707_03895 [Mycobacterium kyorinense]|uniref:Conserved hypothetical protein CHP02391 domain-containing protein n=1 Tax=Mycobacterium kyorinense TaxID=487514 RepID=A0A1A2Z424_9MYCO|nr:TIGR02391 family protein [Mycobacterium kyorinense]OBI43921.1 hypothetical protein A5707_03895 [Mycobacterium kyorinense]